MQTLSLEIMKLQPQTTMYIVIDDKLAITSNNQ